MEQQSERAGRDVIQPEGYAAFVPNPLPPEIRYGGELQSLLSAADRAMSSGYDREGSQRLSHSSSTGSSGRYSIVTPAARDEFSVIEATR